MKNNKRLSNGRRTNPCPRLARELVICLMSQPGNNNATGVYISVMIKLSRWVAKYVYPQTPFRQSTLLPDGQVLSYSRYIGSMTKEWMRMMGLDLTPRMEQTPVIGSRISIFSKSVLR